MPRSRRTVTRVVERVEPRLYRAPRYGSLLPNPTNYSQRQRQYRNSGFRNITDPVVVDATSTTSALAAVSTAANGTGSINFSLNSSGIYGTNAGNTAIAVAETPHLAWLTQTTVNFEEYRVTRATLVVIGNNVGSTTLGEVSVSSSTNYVDYAGVTGATSQSLIGARAFSLSALASNNKRVALDIDTSWKKVSPRTISYVNSLPVAVASADDLIFSNVFVVVIGGPASTTNLLNFYVEYDCELRRPASRVFNA